MKAVVVIPTFNERDNISRLIRALQRVLEKIKNWNFKILVVDDNSPDGTAAVVKEITKRNKKIRLLLRDKKTGLGAAYLAGMKEAFDKMKADVVLVMDADLSHDPRYLTKFFRLIEEGKDFVVGSRYVNGGSIPRTWAPHRKFLSVFGNKIVPLILGDNPLTDWTSGYRAIRKMVYYKVKSQIAEDKAEFRGYTFNISFAYHAVRAGFKVSEVPIKFIDRTAGKSKLGFEYLLHTPLFLLKTRLKEVLKAIINV